MTDAVKKNGVNFGIIVAVVSILATSLMYAIDLKLFMTWWIGIILFLISLAIGIVGVAKAKKQLGGYISFKEAFTTYFIIMALGSAISIVFSIILLNVIDPAAKDTLKQYAIELAVEMGQKFGTPTKVLKQQVELMEQQDSYSVTGQALSYVWVLLFHAIVALIVAVSMKKNKPEFQ